MLAGAMMMLRVLVVVAVANAALLPTIAPALALGALTQAGFGALLAWRAGADEGAAAPLALSNPFDLSSVLQ
ncbi:DUF4010 domain-containing protein, partial [Microbacteriaceae bacterium K1510]|nr:DUF4010 domain-containing protein [Microbacteriaceae bacterium K1510]